MTKIELILLKSKQCGHCISFLPIFNKIIKKKIYKCHVFETTNIVEKKNFTELFPDINKIFDLAVPTLYLKVDDKFQEISRTNTNNDEDDEVDRAADELLEIVENGIKTLQSNDHTLYIHTGGEKNEEYYKQKYIKYKNKYLQEKIK